MAFKISPKYYSTKLDSGLLEDIVDVYEDKVRGWLINCGRILNHHEHAGFGVLQTALAYFESYTIFFRGEDSYKRSKEFFAEGFNSVFPKPSQYQQSIWDEFIKILYKDGRCGLSHFGMTRTKVLLQDGSPTFRLMINSQDNSIQFILVDRYSLVDSIDQHFSNYVMTIRDKSESHLRNNFYKAWQLLHS
ncbi:hypothetical protein [Synechococcus elongatus]|uniref:hypothetical protein n=1 Tax=Synechococcus elongatus TaxID=32046 RepID=UPI000585A666|nr:hypothetical protein [Synechococcus elongatus]AJD58878.1 hypothetical protein M744_05680 [Synechococcus elongatus UTEX 2973]MBD2586888.1 hypothetical protein [Synechococcus elongatus FACHB-242]MBD2687959.1 hypothetical protein [Synechococcus elongatus FACHB-1061]MBD2706330.1 hypothetical protein [Synechococcus elongatus PCC 7942 = FACHB-805]UOW71962.1 hypothetical protein PCC7943_2220 [Synechococcus elongatus PCC 7943]